MTASAQQLTDQPLPPKPRGLGLKNRIISRGSSRPYITLEFIPIFKFERSFRSLLRPRKKPPGAPRQTNSPMQIGWSTNVPARCAIIPVMNGAIAPPELPTDPMRDSDEIGIFRGMRRWKICVAQGYTGPSISPEKATATELPTIDGANQMRSSRTIEWGDISDTAIEKNERMKYY